MESDDGSVGGMLEAMILLISGGLRRTILQCLDSTVQVSDDDMSNQVRSSPALQGPPRPGLF